MLSTVWTTEKRRGRKETEVARRIKGESKGERQIQLVISSLSVLHSLEHTKRITELGREETLEGSGWGRLGNLGLEKGRAVQAGERPLACWNPEFDVARRVAFKLILDCSPQLEVRFTPQTRTHVYVDVCVWYVYK